MSTTATVLLFIGLIALSAFLVAARSAIVNVHRARLRKLSEDGVARAGVAERLAEDSSRLLATAQLGLILTTFFASAVVAWLAVPPLAAAWEPWMHGAAIPVAFGLVVLVAALVMLILGELVPEMIALQHSERLALALARPLAVVELLFTPVVRLAVWLSNATAWLFGARATGAMPFVTEQEIKTLVDAGEEEGVIEEDEKEMIYSIFDLGDTLARQVMVPRIDVAAVDDATPMTEALDTIMSAGHSRIPVYSGTIDNVVGVLYAKDLLPYLRDGRTDEPLRNLVRPAYFIPETKRAGDLLPDLQQRRVHMAIVVDEYGGMAGIVTIEDLLEEIVGEIQDEYDAEEPTVVPVSENEYLVDARIDLGDLNDLLDAHLPTEESDTLGGFIYAELGKVPAAGDRVTHADLIMAVESVHGRRIRKVRVFRTPVQPPEGKETPTPSRESDANSEGQPQ